MGSFTADEQQEGIENKYLRLAEPENGKTTELRVRILDQRPERVFRHWIGSDPKSQRPYNCLGGAKAGCLACYERGQLKEAGIDHRDTYRMDKRYLVNVLAFGTDKTEVKIFSFGSKLGDKLDFLHDRHGDLRDFDVTIIKRKTGPHKFNVEYDAVFEEKRDLTDAEKSLAEERHDLKPEVVPAKAEDIASAVNISKGKEMPVSTELATDEDIAELETLAKKRKFTLADLKVRDPKTLPKEKFEELKAALA